MDDLKDISDQRINWAKENPSLCFFPWDTVEFRHKMDPNISNPSLRSSCCCNLQVENISDTTFDNLKNEMNAGVLPSACWACKHEEENGGISERIRGILGKSPTALENFLTNRSVNEFEIRIAFSSICSLACRSCDPASSSTYAKITKDLLTVQLEKDLIDNIDYFDQIKSIFKSKRDFTGTLFLHLTGGEPLLTKGLNPLLDWLINNDFSELITIRITTAISTMPDEELLFKFDRFNEVQFIFSIDSVGENYHYVRWPAKFEKIERNLQSIVDFKKQSVSGSIFQYILSPVFSLNNVFYIKDYLDYWYKWYKNNDPMYFVHTNLLHRTNHLDFQSLPNRYRTKLKEILEECLLHPLLTDSEYKDRVIHLYNFLHTTIHELNNWPEDLFLWECYLEHVAEFDLRTNTKFAVLNQRLYNLLTNEDISLFQTKLDNVDTTKQMILRKR